MYTWKVGRMSDMREAVRRFEAEKALVLVKEGSSPRFEVARIIAKRTDDQALLFEKVKGHDTRIVANLCSSRLRLSQAIQVPEAQLYERFTNAMSTPSSPRVSNDFGDKVIEEEPKLSRLPILTHYPKDPGPYLTSAIVSAFDSEQSIENVSIHRMLVLDDEHLCIRIVPRQLYRLCQQAKERGKHSLDVAISIGLNPAVLLAASSPVPFGVSEYSVANSLMGGTLSLTRCSEVDARAPSAAEIILEGQILLDKEADEGPFVDLTGTYDIVRKQPVVRVCRQIRREDYIYQALLPGGKEHKTLMGFPYEVRIWEALKTTIPGTKAVAMTPGGCGWLHVVISITKQTEGDGKNALLAAFGAHPSLKHAIVVDADIDINKPEEVEWAIATRFRADKGLLIIDNVRGSSLDPSADQVSMIGAKMGLDATRPLSKSPEKFERARI
jgi:UbiD family decarboxylase